MCSHWVDDGIDDLTALLNPDISVSTDSLSPLSRSSLSGDDEPCSSGSKRHRSHGNYPLSPKRFRGTMDEVHSPESGIGLSPAMALYTQNPNCGNVSIEILEQPEEVDLSVA